MIASDAAGARSRALALAVLREPVGRRAWLATMHLATGALVAVTTALVLLVLIALTGLLAVTVVGAVACLAAVVIVVDASVHVQRARFVAFLDVHLHVDRRVPSSGMWVGRMPARVREPAVWRRFGYHLLASVLAPLSAAVVLSAWVAAVVLPLFALFRLLSGDDVPWLWVIGVVAFFAAPWLARAGVGLDLVLARALLQRSARDVLAEQVESLVESRAGLREAADAERRRIERDLHDGAQQQLTSLAMNLGIARQTLPDLPDPAREVIVSAHEDAKSALADLRNLVRACTRPCWTNVGWKRRWPVCAPAPRCRCGWTSRSPRVRRRVSRRSPTSWSPRA
ncbi:MULTISPECIES: sensor histidine kinase [Saccharothrix]|uniref:sensor histidine kinase n=1 Tax=Saccharothrix TaxID=2071 RepID=UPI000965861D|nr:histidine kinase [Saccharothrix sp. CB00851]OKI26968.1 hypothetical protein A6A25_06910 [Saccharothrix sp. CB00851]